MCLPTISYILNFLIMNSFLFYFRFCSFKIWMYSVYLSQMENNFHVPYSIRCPICSYLKHIFSSLVAVYVALGGGFWQCRDICRSYFSDMDAINTLGSINVYNSLDQVFHYLFAISINIQGNSSPNYVSLKHISPKMFTQFLVKWHFTQ